MKTLTLAQIYELQGLKQEALDIYHDILKEDPENQEAQSAIQRLSGIRRQFEGVNESMKQFFIDMENEDEFNEFEQWLSEL
ncbi:MAG: hypothetical protein DSY46_01025 [Hydrogenimonas sp.]|nr:MAG: hypothetical protein DSY46_01025 [Hydrogenimonas sp.]